MAIVEETKETPNSWRNDYVSYEALKKVIDPRPLPNRRVKPKYGKIRTATMYTNFLFFTNHSDAFQLPEDDRRLAVLECNKGRRSFDEYGQLRSLLNDELAIAAIYHWYLARDINDHDPIYPPMTPAKKRMVSQGKHALDDVWAEAMEQIPGDVVTKKQLIAACDVIADDDEELMSKARSMARQRWRKLPKIETINDRQQISVGGKLVTIRAIRNTKELEKIVAEDGTKILQNSIEENLQRYRVI